mmetsp:Transcript_37734/g.36186  ORF Transcript_37734/g.36186 Transcript_37734/m.36186 type:complete len:105 (-) Transcript_37734:1-315(-)
MMGGYSWSDKKGTSQGPKFIAFSMNETSPNKPEERTLHQKVSEMQQKKDRMEKDLRKVMQLPKKREMMKQKGELEKEIEMLDVQIHSVKQTIKLEQINKKKRNK